MTQAMQEHLETHYLKALNACRVPDHLQGGLVRYLVYRIPPGHFLIAVLENDLREAMGRADEESRAGLFALVSFLYSYAPMSAWGSPELVESWLLDEPDIVRHEHDEA